MPAPVAPGSRLSTPIAPPQSRPVALLQQNGFNGDINDFNHRIQAVYDAHTQALGYPPSPGLTLAVARNAEPGDYPGLFSRTSRQSVQTQTVLANHRAQNPDDYFVTRPDGISQPSTPLYRMINSVVEHPVTPPDVGAPQAPTRQPTAADLQKKYPMVMMGALPIPSMDHVMAALNYLNTPPPTSSTTKLPPGVFFGLAPGSINPLEAGHGHEVQQQLAVNTIKQAQVELNKQMGTSLPTTGVFNDTWLRTVANWQRSTDYFKKQLAFQASQEGFGSNTAAYIKAWQAKQAATQHGLWGQFLAAMPLPLFGHGGFWQDAGSIPGYLKGSSDNPINIGLHSLTKTAGLTLDTIGGTVSQAKVDLAAGTALARVVIPVPGTQQTYEEALANARKQLHANPSWMRALGFGYLPTNEPAWLKAVDQVTNVAGDLILLRKPTLTGERVAAGDLAAAKNSTYLNTAAGWAYQDLAKFGADGIGRAASRLEGGQGARALVARAAPLVKNGSMTQEQFANHVAELYAGSTTLTLAPAREGAAAKTVVVQGPLLTSLQSAKLPTPGAAGQWLLEQKHGLRDALDEFDATARGTNSGLVNRAGDLVATLRSSVAHAAPQGGRLGYFQDILPERVFNFTMKHKLGDDTAALANKLESDLVRFQGKENVRGIQAVEEKLQTLYHQKYGAGTAMPKDDPFHALLETEAPSVFKFPGGTQTGNADQALQGIQAFTSKVNAGLNKAAKLHARIILSGVNPLTGFGGFSLFWKHAVGDGLRAVVGGIASALTPEVRAAKQELATLAASDPEIARRYGALLDRLRSGEANWALNRGGWNVNSESFATGDKLGSRAHMNAAGEFLRRQLDSKALLARQDGTIVQTILKDKTLRGLWHAAQTNARKADPTATLSAEDYAALIEERYKAIEGALAAKNLSLDDASSVMRANVGHDAGPALGKWIKDNGLDFPVDHGQVETRGTFDDLTGRWVGNVIMRPNKFWRSNFGETILAKHYAELRKAGFEQRPAFDVASQVAERVTKFHLLDFSNRLQIEQDMRWLSYFATKHRLYFKWVLSTFARNPRYAAAVSDFAKSLNQSGGISVPITVAGQRWQIPAERMVWVPGREYDETSPLALGVWNFIKSGGNLDAVVKGATGTQGNVLTRSDTATRLGIKLLNIHLGKAGATYSEATAGLDKKTADLVTRALNEYQVQFMHDHGHYAPESQAVTTVLTHQLGQEYWRANLPLPIVPDTNRTDQQQLMAQYMTLIEPGKRARFLNRHPGFSDNFGVYQDPKVYLHNREFFQRWTSALDAYHAARRDLYAQAKNHGEWTTELEQKRRDLNGALQTTQQQLLIQDAHSAGIDTKGGVPNGTTIPYGPWGKVVNKDPQFDPSHFLSAMFPKLAAGQQGDIIGPLQRSLQNELKLLADPAYVRASIQTPEEVKTLKREILQKLAVFNAYPSDALGKSRDTYQTAYVNKYWAAYDAKVNAIKNLPSDQRRAADATFRAWRDSQDHAVTVDGIKFPAPLRMAWATLDPKTRNERLSYLASKPLSSLADYELDLLGVPHPANTSVALAAFEKTISDYQAQNPGATVVTAQRVGLVKEIDKVYPGFYRYYATELTQPRVDQYAQTTLYKDLAPAIKAPLDQYIIGPAKELAAAIKANGSANYYIGHWRQYVREQLVPWLNDPAQKQLKAQLDLYGPNFLGTLPSRG